MIFLNCELSAIGFLPRTRVSQFKKLGINTVKDLITAFPYRYSDTSEVIDISTLKKQGRSTATLLCRVLDIKSSVIRHNLSVQNILLADFTDSLIVKSFNQHYLINSVSKDEKYYIQLDRRTFKNGRESFVIRSMEKHKEQGQLHLGIIAPVYRLTAGLSIKAYRTILKKVLNQLVHSGELENLFSNEFYKEFDISVNDLVQLHFPEDISKLDSAVRKFAGLEIATLYLKSKNMKSKTKSSSQNQVLISRKPDRKLLSPVEFENLIEKKLTFDQFCITQEIFSKLKNNEEINFLIQGDVGSGKSLIAYYSLLLFALAGYDTVLLCPTSILVDQHFMNLVNYSSGLPVKIFKVSSDGKFDNSYQPGSNIFVGTTSVLFRKFRNISLVVIDEQQKFGVVQREYLNINTDCQKNVVEMTATPIPRTLVKSIFEDIEVKTIKSIPFGKRDIKTYFVSRDKIQRLLSWCKEQLSINFSNKIIWVVPSIENEKVSNLNNEVKLLQQILEEFGIVTLTGRMTPEKKSKAVTEFKENRSRILLSTSIIEIGIDIPDANIIVISSPQMFGLSQLHQMRGRVGRSGQKSYCYLLEREILNESQKEKLKFFCQNSDGLVIAEKDLELRGPGDLFGTRQIGLPDLKIANYTDLAQVRLSIDLAKRLTKNKTEKVLEFLESSLFS
ncbi:DEAD/DEAH box helicase [Candidatus Dojkabacteria bacterium]|uniref:Probable DNA 3'-5' helicase RecG n=1 Tax=Candidatus Dojkabacteria bacterium TaxID=2099670 RepID=A0A3M0Z449_9BACT|nr:MAG: DEAD/DEAH box helicase [Candidatus Dojkabacteria bacterium]